MNNDIFTSRVISPWEKIWDPESENQLEFG